jgi:subtilisin family serine protease
MSRESRPEPAVAGSAIDASRFTRPEAIVVRARSNAALPTVEARAAALRFDVLSRVEEPPSLLLSLTDEATLEDAIAAFTAAEGVLYAEPAYPIRSHDLPSDPLFGQVQRQYLEPMGAPAAWDITTGSPNIVVAVLDTGLFTQHPDLVGRVWSNPREIPGNGIDDDRNGCVDDVNGCTFLHAPDSSCAPIFGGNITDDVGHGTFVAGVIAASANGQGIVGVARNATVLPVKILDCSGNGNTFSLAQGILYAVEHGARVINVSLGGPVDSAYVRETIRIAREQYGAIIIAATGNSGGAVSYPARYAEVLAVGGTTSAGNARPGYSNSGPEVDVVAFSQGIVSTAAPTACGRFNCLENDRNYALGDGTSFAAPIVSGLAVLMLSRNPLLSPDAIAAIMKATADPMPASDRPDWAGAGRVNMQRALQLPFRLGTPGSARN